jgi:hypothetical protein
MHEKHLMYRDEDTGERLESDRPDLIQSSNNCLCYLALGGEPCELAQRVLQDTKLKICMIQTVRYTHIRD